MRRTRICRVDQCHHPRLAHLYCRVHFIAWLNTGSPTTGPQPRESAAS